MFLFLGMDPRTFYKSIAGIGWYLNDYFKLKKLLHKTPEFKIKSFYPVLAEKGDSAGTLGHYFYQDLIVAQKLFKDKPAKHVDVGSRVDGFVAHVASFRKIEVIDIRPLESDVDNLSFVQIDFMKPLSPTFIDYTDSVSCLHALEHFGLGRYGDQVDASGHLKGFANLTRILKPTGRLYFSTPIGPQRIEFNAHRVFSVEYLLELFKKDFSVDDFYYIDDKKRVNHPSDFNDTAKIKSNFGCNYGCGIFFLTKKEVM
jgi:SAM-dependent methyltransferase